MRINELYYDYGDLNHGLQDCPDKHNSEDAEIVPPEFHEYEYIGFCFQRIRITEAIKECRQTGILNTLEVTSEACQYNEYIRNSKESWPGISDQEFDVLNEIWIFNLMNKFLLNIVSVERGISSNTSVLPVSSFTSR